MYKDSNGNIIRKPSKVVIDGCEIHNPSNATLAAFGIVPYVPPTPEPPSEPPPKVYDVNALVYALVTRQKWLAVKDALNSQGLLEAFLTAGTIEEKWLTADIMAAVKAATEMNDGDVAAVLSEAEVG